MVERNSLVATVIIILIALVGGYVAGQFLSQEEQAVITNSTITTLTTTSSITITEISTKTTTIVKELPQTIPSPANSNAIIRGYLISNGSVFVTFSIDKPVYSLGEDIHIKATITNFTPNNISFSSGTAMIWIENETRKRSWAHPESTFGGGFGPAPRTNWINLGSEETISLDWASIDWNMTGLQRIFTRHSSLLSSKVVYNDFLVPEGQYMLIWSPNFSFQNINNEKISDIIPFTITKQD